jgi:hypothetical protein
VPPAPAVFSRCSSQPSLCDSACAIVSPARAIARGTSPVFAEPACKTTPAAPIPSPTRSECVSEASDLARISRSSLAQLTRYTAWISTAPMLLAAIASRNAAKSSSP